MSELSANLDKMQYKSKHAQKAAHEPIKKGIPEKKDLKEGLGAAGRVLGASWGCLGGSWGHSGSSWSPRGAILDAPGGLLGRSGQPLRRHVKHSKTRVFYVVLAPPGPLWGCQKGSVEVHEV